MELFNYSRRVFFSQFPVFQEKKQEGLFCVFDSKDQLKEACLFQKSEVLQKVMKVRSVQVEKDQLIEHFGDFSQSWFGPNGALQYQDKDQNPREEKWTRETKLREVISQMVEAHQAALAGAESEIDQEFKRKADLKARETEFAKINFLNWPKQLGERQFSVWQKLNPQRTADDFRRFFESLKVRGLLDQLNEDELGAELSKWIRSQN